MKKKTQPKQQLTLLQNKKSAWRVTTVVQFWFSFILEWSPACLYVGCMCGVFWLLCQNMFVRSSLFLSLVLTLLETHCVGYDKRALKKNQHSFILKASLWIKLLTNTGLYSCSEFGVSGEDEEKGDDCMNHEDNLVFLFTYVTNNI